MHANKIKNILSQHLSLTEIYVIPIKNHYQIIVVNKILNDKTKLEQHKIIYAPLMKYITQNIIHSVSIHVFSPNEWNTKRHLYKIK